MEPSPLHCLAGAAVAAFDRQARSYNAPCWSSSRPMYQQARETLETLARADTGVRSVAAHLARSPAPREMFHPLVAALHALRTGPRETAVERGRHIADGIRLLYHATDAALLRPRAPERGGGRRRVHVVIPFRSTAEDSLRPRNLRTCLAGLARQTGPRADLTVTVVESDAVPRHRLAVEGRVDRYVFQEDGGPFNKARAVNTGVAATADGGPDDVVCVLDADIAVDARFIARIARATPADGALLPYQDAFCLDGHSSERLAVLMASERLTGLMDAEAERAPGPWSGYLIRRPPGGCLAVTRDAFDRVGGFDPRFKGWGGEDRDVVDRLERHARVERAPGLLVHLMHERPPMRESREEIMNAALRN
ncbi:glycosyltransferase [Streptomyces sp. NPDC018610]|uniref:glycosyltransferase n=1 Tax=Streptomyces sp. NPDC018610 TaxID=3365049 RepID=UPI0037B79F18